MGVINLELAKLLQALRWFHAIEVGQVSLYKTQAAFAADEVDKRMFLKAADIEAQHADSIVAALREYGGEPASLAVLAPVAALGVGAVMSTNLSIALKANVALENLAMRDYGKQIAMCTDKRLRDMFWSNYLDESLHAEWFKARLSKSVDKPGIVEATQDSARRQLR